MSKITIRATDLQVRSALKVHAKHVWLGYVDATIKISAGDVEIFSVRIRNMQCKEFASGLRVDFPSEKVEVWKEKLQKTVIEDIPHCFTNTAISRKRITACMRVALKAHYGESYRVAA
jgi:hypothetical protein